MFVNKHIESTATPFLGECAQVILNITQYFVRNSQPASVTLCHGRLSTGKQAQVSQGEIPNGHEILRGEL